MKQQGLILYFIQLFFFFISDWTLDFDWTVETCGDDIEDLAAGDWKRHKRLSGWTVKTKNGDLRVGNGDDTGDLRAGDQRRQWRLGQGEMEMAVETYLNTQQLGVHFLAPKSLQSFALLRRTPLPSASPNRKVFTFISTLTR